VNGGSFEPVFRVCLDLNVWVSFCLAEAANASGTIIQDMIDIIDRDRSPVGPIQIVMSHAMLERLKFVLLEKFSAPDTDHFVRVIRGFVQDPLLLVVDGGVEPTRDAIRNYREYDPGNPESRPAPPYDPEDGRVLDTAIAARADVLVTRNFKDFWYHQAKVIEWEKLIIRMIGEHEIVIIQPELVMPWLRTGMSPVPKTPRPDETTDEVVAPGPRR
jgi:predicted nucleic acid-binding protein